MNNALSALCSTIESDTRLSAGVGHPNSLSAQISLWPWRITPAEQSLRNLPASRAGSAPKRPKQHFDLFFLMIAPHNLANLIQAAQCALNNPVLQVDGVRYVVREKSLSEELQISLLKTAGIPVQPVMSFAVSEHSDTTV